MVQSYLDINHETAQAIRLIVTDIDCTLTEDGEYFDGDVTEAISRLEAQGIMVGLASGRTMARLETLARDWKISGPLIAENGAVARLKAGGKPIDLGYSREPAIKDYNRLKKIFPRVTLPLERNRNRLIDMVIDLPDVATETLNGYLENTELLDSGYMVHILPKGISKGQTLFSLLDRLADGGLKTGNLLVIGDSKTDLSLFQLFPHSVLVLNPGLPPDTRQTLEEAATYVSTLPFGKGFTAVCTHLLSLRVGLEDST